MKAYVTHDENGNIVSISMPNADVDHEISVVAESGHQICEVDLPIGTAKDFADEEKGTAKLIEIAEQFKIDMPTRKGKLVKTSQSRKRAKRAPPKRR